METGSVDEYLQNIASMDDEIKALMKQRNELNHRIEMLKNGCRPVQIGRTEFSLRERAWGKCRKYFSVRLNAFSTINESEGRLTPIIQTTNRIEAIQMIPEFIRDLQALYDKLTEDTNGNII